MTTYLDTAAVGALLGVTAETVRRYRQPDRTPPFPEPDIVLQGRAGWREETIREWIAQRPYGPRQTQEA